MHTQETDGGRGIPHLLHGLYPTIDDLAKLTTLLQNGGQHQGQQLLSAAKLAEALYKTDAMGLPNSRKNRFGEGRYHLSFWSVPYRTSNGCFFQIPYMAGYGGNLVVLLPNGISAFRFADGDNWDLEAMVLAGEALRPFCAAGTGTAGAGAPLPPLEHQPLTASDLRAVVPGNRFYTDHLHLFPAADGVLYGTSKEAIDIGTWQITPDGQFCRTWHVWDSRRERCFAVYQEGEAFALYMQEGWGKVLFRRTPGNPESYFAHDGCSLASPRQQAARPAHRGGSAASTAPSGHPHSTAPRACVCTHTLRMLVLAYRAAHGMLPGTRHVVGHGRWP